MGDTLVLWRLLSTVGDNISTVERIASVQWGITSILWRVFSTVGDKFNTLRDSFSAVGG